MRGIIWDTDEQLKGIKYDGVFVGDISIEFVHEW